MNKKQLAINSALKTEGKRTRHLAEPATDKDEIKTALNKALAPYNKEGKTNFPLRNKAGVYIIFEGKKIIYVGYSRNNLYRTMYRHFETWTDKTQYRMKLTNLTGIKLAVIYTEGERLAKLLENALILRYRPDLNVNKYDGFTTDEKEKEVLKKLGQIKPGIYTYTGELEPF